MRNILRLTIFVLCCGAGVAWADGAHHTLWQIKGNHNTVYLLGSVHFLPPDEQLPVEVVHAYQNAATVVMEMDMDDLDPVAIQAETLRLGLLPENQTLE